MGNRETGGEDHFVTTKSLAQRKAFGSQRGNGALTLLMKKEGDSARLRTQKRPIFYKGITQGPGKEIQILGSQPRAKGGETLNSIGGMKGEAQLYLSSGTEFRGELSRGKEKKKGFNGRPGEPLQGSEKKKNIQGRGQSWETKRWRALRK